MHDHPRSGGSHVRTIPRKPERKRGRKPKPPDALAVGGTMLRDRRGTLGLRLEDVADRVNISIAYASEVERGKKCPSASVLVEWAEFVGLDPAAVLCAFRVVPDAAAERFFDVDRMRAALAGGV